MAVRSEKGLFMVLWDDQVEDDAGKGCEADAADCECADGEFCAADSEGQDEGCDDQVAGVAQVDLVLDQGVDADGCDGSEKEEHDAAEDCLRDGLEDCADLAEDREQDAEYCGYAEYGGVCDLGE